MNDLISRQSAIDAIITLWANKPFGNPALTEIKECVKRVPSAQPEIVRCGECKHYEPFSHKGIKTGIGVCDVLPMEKTVSDSWFCADGERR